MPRRSGARRRAEFGEVSCDVLGSSWVRVPGTGGGPSLAIVGHIDEIALVVTHVGDDGLIAVRQLGGFDPHVLLGQRVEILTRDGPLPASSAPASRSGSPVRTEGRSTSTTCTSTSARRTARRRGSSSAPGDAALMAGAPVELRERPDRLARARQPARLLRRARGRAPHRRRGRRAGRRRRGRGRPGGGRRLRRRPHGGLRPRAGGRDRRRRHARDRRPRRRSRGRGRAQARRRPGAHARPVDAPAHLRSPVRDGRGEGIPFTVEVSRGHTFTDADAVYLSRAGIATGLVSVPLRYMHTPVEIVDLDDVEAAVRLLVAFARRLEPGTRASLASIGA